MESIFIDAITQDRVSLTYQAVDVNQLINFAKSEKSGAIATFIGTTRDNFEGMNVVHLSYEAYPEMALEEMKNIVNKIRSQWDVNRVVIEHKLGTCPILDISVFIAVSSAHRNDALRAVDFAINELKRCVPIWKKEFYSEEEPVWKENKEFVPTCTSSCT